MLWLGVDVGGTFTDLVLFDLAARQAAGVEDALDAAQPVRGHPGRHQPARHGAASSSAWCTARRSPPTPRWSATARGWPSW